MNENDNTEPKQIISIETMSDLDIIAMCGKLKYTVEKTASILFSKNQSQSLKSLIIDLSTPGSAEQIAYQSGIDAGDFESDMALYNDALSGSKTSVDSSRTLHNIQKERDIDRAVKDKFFSDPD